MKCPVDDEQLVMTDRSGVEIDYCPKCRGVWLDRGELDKIIDRSSAENRPPEEYRPSAQGSHHAPAYGGKPYRGKKKKSMLGELFDF